MLSAKYQMLYQYSSTLDLTPQVLQGYPPIASATRITTAILSTPCMWYAYPILYSVHAEPLYHHYPRLPGFQNKSWPPHVQSMVAVDRVYVTCASINTPRPRSILGPMEFHVAVLPTPSLQNSCH